MLPLLVLGSQHVAAQEVLPDDFVVETYVSGIDAVKMAWTPDQQWMYIGSKDGRVYLAKNGELVPGTFMDIRDEVNTRGDRGMLGLAVHPEFPTKNWVYLLYTYDPPETFDQADPAAANGGPGQRVARLIRVTADPATDYESHIPGSEVVILGTASTWENIGDPTAEQDEPDAPWSCGQRPAYVQDCLPSDGLSHSIGNVEFGSDGMLYVSVGDSATWSTVDPKATRSLDVDSLGGKILRIDPETGAGLPDNPFFDGDPTSNRSRVLHLGLRNPFRFTVTDDGEVWIGDVGWEKWEEVNHGEPGADFGWPCYEGDDLGSAEQPRGS